MEEGPEDTEIHTLPSLSHDAQALVALHAEWRDLYAARERESRAFAEAAAGLAGRIVEHRSRLFEASASLQAERDASATGVERQLEANQDAIKFCTIMLGEINAALGTTSIPPR